MDRQTGELIRVLIAVSLPSAGRQLARQLMLADEIMVAATARTAEEAIALARICGPDVIILDPMITHMDIVPIMAKLRGEAPSAAIVVVSASSDPQTLQRLLKAGARACLPFPPAANRLIEAVRRVDQAGRRGPPAQRPPGGEEPHA